ncbi:L,D-transpeptidase family protein [Rhodovibrio sodomensis]|nr:L,D-transpeptidase family protein [Rhodovibrio sodomensis]
MNGFENSRPCFGRSARPLGAMPLGARPLGALKTAMAAAVLLLAAPMARAADGDAPPETPDIIGAMQTTTAHYETTFADLAYLHNLGYVELVAANPKLDPWMPGAGKRITLPKRHILPNVEKQGIVINLAEPRLYYFPADQPGTVKTFPIGIGREGLDTPTGETKVTRKRRNPAWRPTREARAADPSLPAVVRAGPENPLGAYALDLGWPLYLIHGTNNVWGIGRRVSRGCIRMYPNDIQTLYNTVPSNTPVQVVEQPLKFAWDGDTFYMEAHTTTKQAGQLEKTGSFEPDADLDLKQRVMTALGERVAQLDWATIRQAVRQRRGVPIAIGHAVES